MIRSLVLILLFKSILLGCSICSIYSPRTDVSINIVSDDTHIRSADFKWVFVKNFTKELLKIYDTNLDGTFDEEELIPIKNSLLSYIEAYNYLTFISYSKEIENESRTLDIKNYKMIFKDSILSFEYTSDLNYKIVHNNNLYIHVNDDTEYFIMHINKKEQALSTPYEYQSSISNKSVSYTISLPESMTKENKSENKLILDNFKDENLEKPIVKSKSDISLLDQFIAKIKESLLEVEKGEDKYAIFFLLFASFVYGLIHALGPGHGKALAFSYFSSRKNTYFQAFSISFFTAFIHILGALVLVSISIFIIEEIFSSFLDDSISYITKVSAVLIILLSLYILYRKLKNKSCACSGCNIENNSNTKFIVNNDKNQFILRSSDKVHKKSDVRTQNLFFVLTAGLVPCPGTVILFVYAFILETYFAVFLASIFISLGMGIVIFASSFLGVSLYKVSSKSSNITNILEIISPIIMCLLGLFLFFS